MFATLDDVKRVLRIPLDNTDNDIELTAALEAANDLVSRKVHVRYLNGERVTDFYEVAADALLPLPAEEIVVSKVEVASYPDEDLYEFDDYYATGNAVRLGGNFGGMGVWDTRHVRNYYQHVRLTYTALDTVPAGLRDATALYAVGFYPEPLQSQGNVISEKLGDYSYTLSAKDEGGVPYRTARANELLAPYIHGGGAFVV